MRFRIGRYSRMCRWLPLAVLLAGCVDPGPGGAPAAARVAAPRTISRAVGFAVVGDTTAVHFGLIAGDTLPEVAASAVPAPARATVARVVAEREIPAHCVRYFAASDRYMVLLDRECRWERQLNDGVYFIGLGVDGVRLGAWPYYPVNEWSAPAICPAYRDTTGWGRRRESAPDGCMRAAVFRVVLSPEAIDSP